MMRHFIISIILLIGCAFPVSAADPHSAYYSADTDKLIWFIHASDTHIGTSGSTDTTNLQWLTGQAKSVINPSFIVVTGDLTDSTNGNIFGYPNGPYQAEWDQYKSILGANGVDASSYFDIPGNHDAYNDQYFSYYLNNSVQGRATGRTQASWTRTGPWGKYHFLGVNTPDNTGKPFSIVWPYGDNAGLDTTELSFISSEMNANSDAKLTLVFGHHPLVATDSSSDTYLFYGKDDFVNLMNGYGASMYGYGHTHASSEKFFTQNMTDGVFYFNVSSIGKDSPNQFTVTAIDCNGISSVTQTKGTWPVVLITAPVDRRLGGVVTPYAYNVTNSATNPVRALVFDPATVTQVQFRVNGGSWQPMQNVSGNPALWQGNWNASTLAASEYALEVQATTGSGVRSDGITAYVESPLPTAPSGLTATAASGSQINLAWADNSTNEQGFKIERCAGAGCSDFSQITTVGANVTTWSNTGLTASTSYSYRVRAYNLAGDSAYSPAASVTTFAASAVPSAPTGLAATAVSKSQINLAWTDNANNETQFLIERCKGSTCTNFAQVAAVGANVTSYSNTKLTANTVYRYRVRARNAAGSSGYSNVASATTPKR
ncbi:fibronectin type III domain-containing protein [Geomonas agri]|uniref:fibronectin type III domain-containing protein n=1 Tax=Geomonas agri TaxID=2873702 RepID=UPI001CD39972|nr:fibronectin type III domain-containing protein [Geomonas agri]